MLSTKEIGAIAEKLLYPSSPDSVHSNHPSLDNKELRRQLFKMIVLSGGNPLDPLSVEDYTQKVSLSTLGRPAELFLTSFFLNYQPQAPTIDGDRVRDGAVFVDTASWSLFCRNQRNPELPSGLASQLFLLRLLTNPETMEIKWFNSNLLYYRGGIPERVRSTIYYLNKGLYATWQQPDASLDYHVIFAAADGVKISQLGAGTIEDSLLLSKKAVSLPQIEFEILPLESFGRPVSFAVDTTLAAARQDAESFVSNTAQMNPGSEPQAVFTKLPAREKLSGLGATLTVARPPFRRFLVVTANVQGKSVAHIADSWDEVTDPGRWQ